MSAENLVSSAPAHYLLARDNSVLVPHGLPAVDLDFVVEQLDADPRVEVVRELRPRTFRAMTLGTSVTDQIVQVRMSADVAAELRGHPQLLVEEDLPLSPHRSPLGVTDPGVISPFGLGETWTVRVSGPAGEPVVGATVYLYGSGVPAQGRTGTDGEVTLSLINDSASTLRALYVNPAGDYWSLWLADPVLFPDQVNTVRLTPLADEIPGFPGTEHLGWGQRAMRLDQVPSTLRGAGVRVCVVDSGAARDSHSDLRAVTDGIDLTVDPSDRQGWRTDEIAHGSHCTGIISGSTDGGGVRGFAPDATVLQAKIFPGGRISSLVDALDFCIDEEVDVVNLSLGTGGSSQVLLQKIAQAAELGIACIVAAGNTGGGVQFPGTSPDVLTVAAVGQDGTFPADSYHGQQRWKAGLADGGFFAAQFSCHGPQIDVCGPGVAIVSSVPPNTYAAWDGTSMATPHVTGLAALVLAHHPDFRSGALTLRSRARVDRLFAILRAAATPLHFGDAERSGAGLPDSVQALGLSDPGSPQRDDASAGEIADPAHLINSALAQLALMMQTAGLSVNPPAGSFEDMTMQFSRALAELAARMESAGLIDPGRG